MAKRSLAGRVQPGANEPGTSGRHRQVLGLSGLRAQPGQLVRRKNKPCCHRSDNRAQDEVPNDQVLAWLGLPEKDFGASSGPYMIQVCRLTRWYGWSPITSERGEQLHIATSGRSKGIRLRGRRHRRLGALNQGWMGDAEERRPINREFHRSISIAKLRPWRRLSDRQWPMFEVAVLTLIVLRCSLMHCCRRGDQKWA